MQFQHYRAGDRGLRTYSWLTTYHTFSFGDYYHSEKIHFGALRVVNEDVIAPGKGFGTHPHDNMEIVTIPLSGSIAHKDSMGNSSLIPTGEVQIMSAGTGVEHAEYNALENFPLHLLQIWVFPAKREVPPRYEQKAFEPISENTWQLLISPQEEGTLHIQQRAYFSRGSFQGGGTYSYDLKEKQNGVFFFCLKGSVKISGETLREKDAIGIWDRTQHMLECTEDVDLLAIEVPMDVKW